MTQAIWAHKPTSAVAQHTQKQEGVITLDQARTAGLSDRQVEGMVRRGEWRRPFRAVFIDSSAPRTPMQGVIAASFASTGLASHRLCLWLWGLRPHRQPEELEFSVSHGRSVRLPGVRIYRVRQMPPGYWKGVVALTSPMRALLDTAGVAPDVVSDAMTRAFSLKLFTPRALEAELQRAAVNGKPGVSVLRAALKDLGVGRFTPSELERRARRLFRECGLPEPQVEVVFGEHGEYRIDFFWADADVVVEVDGRSVHGSPRARRRDFRKQNRIVIGNPGSSVTTGSMSSKRASERAPRSSRRTRRALLSRCETVRTERARPEFGDGIAACRHWAAGGGEIGGVACG